MKYWCLTCDDERGPLGGLLPFLDAVLVHLVLHLLQLVHVVQTVSPPHLLHRLAQLRLVGQLLGCLHNLLLQGESALQVPQIRVLLGDGGGSHGLLCVYLWKGNKMSIVEFVEIFSGCSPICV